MNGFDRLDTEQKASDLTRNDLEREVARGRRLRAKKLAAWGRKVAATWASLFRRPGRLLPAKHAAGEHLADVARI